MAFLALATVAAVSACSSLSDAPPAPVGTNAALDEQSAYLIGPTDQLNVFVWHQPDLSSQTIVRPDGKISVPLVNDIQAAGKTPSQLSQDITVALREYIQDPKVTVTVSGFVGQFDRQIRVVGQAAKPQAIPFRRNMSVLDVMIQVGGLTEYAAGNRAVLVRTNPNGDKKNYRLRLADLLEDGDTAANVYVMPGDVIIIPQSYF
jgi:polysaccharide export outer membrane protein